LVVVSMIPLVLMMRRGQPGVTSRAAH